MMGIFAAQVAMTPRMAVLAIIAMLVIVALVVTAILLAYPKTRRAGIVLLLTEGLVVITTVLLLWSDSDVTIERRHAQMARSYDGHIGETERAATKSIEKRAASEPVDDDSAPADPSEATPSEPAEADAAPDPPKNEESPPAEPEKTAADPPESDEPVITVPPAWINTPPQLVGDVYQMTVKIDPRESPEQGRAELPAKLNDAVRRYATTVLNRDPWVARRVQLDGEYLKKNILKETWSEPVLAGNWFEVHALLQFDRKARDHIEQKCEEVIVTRRLWYTGVGFAALVALLGVSLGSLKIDQAAGGSCRGRLGLGAVVAVLALGGAVYAAAALIDEPPADGGATISTELTTPAELATGEVQY